MAHNSEVEELLMETVSGLIRSRRKELGISQEQVEYMAFGVNSKSKWVSRIENGKRKGMTLKTLAKVLHTLKVDIKFEPQEI
ncbi:helix-turn-helix protein [Oceanihabitans sediminis]|uniref:XRE family transcriptional regulator n=1 Tax=Oceanihabitans sediminis TaxID=1812012 RepID=A0A368P7Y2_9FLAO|nr:helix-turn-helix transcriptional regulator [Oceanihabitans sediminis]RBP34219.1 helix-turn-helix protein [Oceanihabitans sediminis]RCU57909.1 XRE family transcriptional regulator [Oceanihabitans sediminis]